MAKIISQELAAEIEKWFTYHAPNPEYEFIRGLAKDFAWYLIKSCPDCEELKLAIQKLQEAVMWANASIARKE